MQNLKTNRKAPSPLVKGTLPLPDEVEHILVIQLGDIGDVVTTIPSLMAIKNRYPSSKLSMLVREPNGEILAEEPYLEEIFSVKKRVGGWLKNLYLDLSLIFTLRNKRFDFVIDLRASDRGAYLAFLTGAPIRVAMHYESLSWRDRFFTHLAPERIFDASRRGPIYQSLEVLRPLGIEPGETSYRLSISPTTLDRVIHRLKEIGADPAHHRLVTLNPFSRWRYKEWPLERWAEVAEKLREKNLLPVLIGAADDEKRAKDIERKTKTQMVNMVGKTPLKELPALLNLAFLHVGIDSAATHIAAAVGTPTLTIFGPTDWRDWAPQGDIHRVIYDVRDCVPCRKKGCNDSEISSCLNELGVLKVINEIETHVNYLEAG